MEAYENMAGMWLVGEDMPQGSSSVTLHPTEKDQFGMPIPNVHFHDYANDIAMRNHAYKDEERCVTYSSHDPTFCLNQIVQTHPRNLYCVTNVGNFWPS